MGEIVTGLASSHAFTLMEPKEWDQFRELNRQGYARRYGHLPPVHPRIAEEDEQSVEVRYERIRNGLAELRRSLEVAKPDVLLVIGDDQNENYTTDNIPQFGVFTGNEVQVVDRGRKEEKLYPCDASLAHILLEGMIEEGFDVSFSECFPDNRLKAHAHGEPLHRVLLPHADIPIIPVFVNGIHWPAPSPSRCYAFGETIAKIVREKAGAKRVGLYASGGLSHFTAGYPYSVYKGPYGYGCISEDFDRKIIEWLAEGKGSKLAELTNAELLEHGELELRSWIILCGAVGGGKAEVLAYEPFYRAIMGMCVAKWEVETGSR